MPEKPVILIADDDTSSHMILQEFLKPLGIKTIITTDGIQAFEECISNFSINLVIMDIRLPRMDGLEAVRMIRKYRPELPIIVFTALNDPEYKFLFKKLNCNDFLLKPVYPKVILETISKYLNVPSDVYYDPGF